MEQPKKELAIPDANVDSDNATSLLIPAGCASWCVFCTLHVAVSSTTRDLSAEPVSKKSPRLLN